MQANLLHPPISINETSGHLQFNEKQVYAFDALVKLARQFSREPDFNHFIAILLMTLSGQFSVANSFALLQKPGKLKDKFCYFSTGKLKNNSKLQYLKLDLKQYDFFLQNTSANTVSFLESVDEMKELTEVLKEAGVQIFCTLKHSERYFGFIGLGSKVNGQDYSAEDISLLSSILDTITPLLESSYLYWEIASLSKWHLDILNNVKHSVFVFNNDWKLKTLNNAGLSMMKIFNPIASSSENFVGKSIQQIFPNSIFQDWAKRFTSLFSDVQKDSIENLVIRSEEEEHIYNSKISITSENQESETNYIISLDDVTKQINSDQRMFELQKFADKGLMISSITHELNNFLAIIIGGANLTQMSLDKGNVDKAKDHIEMLVSNSSKLKRFSEGLLDSTKLDMNKIPECINNIIENILSFVSVQKKFRAINITSNLAQSLPKISIDVNQISQILINFLNNSADAIKEANQGTGKIEITTSIQNESICLMISDNGIGIDAKIKEKLFKERVTTKKTGHGYGLENCAKIIERHNGTVTIDSEVGNGTTFKVNFPLINN